MDIAVSIATRGYFPNEPLLAVEENDQIVVVEGNRRLAAMKVLRNPELVDVKYKRQIQRLIKQIDDPDALAKVPVVIAPDRRSTDRQVAGRHIGTPVLAWRSEDRASFVLEKLSEGYDSDSLREELGFTIADIQHARQTRAIAEMARALDLPQETRSKLEGPTAKVLTTLERVFESSVGRERLHIAPDYEHGFKGLTTKAEFLKGFRRLVIDIASGKQSSRTLNKSENISDYFDSWAADDLPKKKRGSFIPSDISNEAGDGVSEVRPVIRSTKKSKAESKTVIPRSFRIRYGDERLVDIRKELTRLRREENPNAGAILLRVFFELAAMHYLKRTNRLEMIIKRIESKTGRAPASVPTLKQLIPELKEIAKTYLTTEDARRVEKALSYDKAAPFTIAEMHGFVHSPDLPGSREIQQFWARVEPLMHLMLGEDSVEGDS